LHNANIADVVVAKNLNFTHNQVQIQALEASATSNHLLTSNSQPAQLIRGKRIFSRTSVQTTPKRFLFIALLPTDSGPRLVQHLVTL